MSAVAFIGVTAVLVHRTGVLLLGLGIIAGQLVVSLALDAFFTDGSGINALTVVGTALALVAVLIAGSKGRVRVPAFRAAATSVPRA